MRKLLAIAILATCLPAGAARADTISLDDLLAKNLAARGGKAKIDAIKSLRLTGKVQFGGGDFKIEAEFAVLTKDPTMIRTEATLQGLTQVSAYDGKDAWQMSPFGGRREAEKQSADDTKGLAHSADWDGPLIGGKEEGSVLEYLGTEDVDGTPAHKIRVTRKDGDIDYVFLDPDSYLEIRITSVSKIRGTESIGETDLGGYQQVEGVWIPFSIDSGGVGGPRNNRIIVEHAEANITADDALFRFPAKGTPINRAVIADASAKGGTADITAPEPTGTAILDGGTISGLNARNIGSAAMSGRVAAVDAYNEGGKTVVFVGAASGGVWKSLDGGTTFKPVFDKQPVQSIGAIAVDPTNHKNVWVGTGEAWTRNSVSIGNGIYKSTDGGETWSHMGLPESERITKIVVHPKDGKIVYACAPGKLWSDSKERGLYKTTDGGKSWSLVLAGGNQSTGCSGITLDPKNPDTLFAGMWDFRRKGWTFRSGGDGPDAASASGLYKSTDGGKKWTQLTDKTAKGLPAAPWGRIEVVMAPSNAKIIYALVESKASALYRSSDGGATWEERDKSQMMVWRPFYFARLVVDPTNPERLFKPDLGLAVSEDGGKTFSGSGGGSHGDWHDLWIDPANPKHVMGGDDGGFWISHDGGNRWWKVNSLPISQFYHVSIDDKDPYQVYGGLQDNSTWVGDSAYPGGITNARWENLYGGDGFWAIPDPTDPNFVYCESQGGYIGRVDRKTLSQRDIQPKAKFKEKLRFNWNSPIAVSPTQKKTLYLGSQFLFRSKDRGDTWERISPDLTTNDPEKQKQEQSGGVTVDNSSAEMHTTIYSISESPKNANTIWVGTDDGNVQLTTNGGKKWTNLTANITGLPANSWVSWVQASPHAAGTAYAAFDRHTFGDMSPYVYVTTDSGKTWKRIASPDQGIRGYAHVIKDDPVKPDILYLGTEFGLWISIDRGATWAEFKGSNFPSVAVREVQVQPRDHDLVIATHGRGIWIIDDLTALRALSKDTLQKPTTFLPSRPAQQRLQGSGGWVEGDASFVGDNPPSGLVITYYLRTRHIYGPISLEILDSAGKVVDTLSPSKRRGINRVVWNMRVKPPRVPRAAQIAFSSSQGPRVVPGTYTIRIKRGKDTITSKVEIKLDRRAKYSVADRKAQFAAVMKAHALFEDMSKLADKLDGTRGQVADRLGKVKDADLKAKLTDLSAKLETIKKLIVATTEGGAITGEERIREHLDTVYGALNGYEGKPAKYQVERVGVLRDELTDASTQFDDLVKKDVRGLDDLLKKAKLTPIAVLDDHEPETEKLSDVAIECLESQGRNCEDTSAVAEEND
jgi:photosystem II stability/assembly factor-like uncharacterized protein